MDLLLGIGGLFAAYNKQEKKRGKTMERFSDLCQKDVVNICDGQCLGRVSDLALDWCNGTIEGLIVPYSEKNGLFRRKEELCVPLSCITRVGRDLILVEFNCAQGHIIQE